MKVLFDHHLPFSLAHGGFQIQIEETMRGLDQVGVETEHVRWWDDKQVADLIHFFGAAPLDLIQHAQLKGMKVCQTCLFTETCNRSDSQLMRQGAITRALLAAPFGNGIKRQLTWQSFRCVDLNIVGLDAERRVLQTVFGVSSNRIAIVPLGLPDPFLTANQPAKRGDKLISVGTITPRKNAVDLARLAHESQVPILFVGRPYDESDPYFAEFARLIDNHCVSHHPHVDNSQQLIDLYRGARGFVLMSRYENWCLAAHEAAACGLPLLIPKQKWSEERFGAEASYFSDGGAAANRSDLKEFYQRSTNASAPKIKFFSWRDVGQQLRETYDRLLTSR